jgi:hypothetical protein
MSKNWPPGDDPNHPLAKRWREDFMRRYTPIYLDNWESLCRVVRWVLESHSSCPVCGEPVEVTQYVYALPLYPPDTYQGGWTIIHVECMARSEPEQPWVPEEQEPPPEPEPAAPEEHPDNSNDPTEMSWDDFEDEDDPYWDDLEH